MITLRSERVIKGQAKEPRLVDGGGGEVLKISGGWYQGVINAMPPLLFIRIGAL